MRIFLFKIRGAKYGMKIKGYDKNRQKFKGYENRVAENCLLPWSARENIPPSLDKRIGGLQKLVKFIDP